MADNDTFPCTRDHNRHCREYEDDGEIGLHLWCLCVVSDINTDDVSKSQEVVSATHRHTLWPERGRNRGVTLS